MNSIALKRQDELEFEQDKPEFKPLIKEGEYEAQCIGIKEFRQYGGTKRLALSWKVFVKGLDGVVLPQFFNMDYKIFKETSFYYQNWVLANNCQRPLRRNRQYMSPKVFKNIIGRVIVCTVIPKFSNGASKPEVFHYSKVQQLLSLSVVNNWRTE